MKRWWLRIWSAAIAAAFSVALLVASTCHTSVGCARGPDGTIG